MRGRLHGPREHPRLPDLEPHLPRDFPMSHHLVRTIVTGIGEIGNTDSDRFV
jgi:hypothetical protein